MHSPIPTTDQQVNQQSQLQTIQQQQPGMTTPVVPPSSETVAAAVGSVEGVGKKDAAGFAIPSLPAPRPVQQQVVSTTATTTDGIPQDVKTIMEMMGLGDGSGDAGAVLGQETVARELEPVGKQETGVSFMQANENGAIVDEDEESESSTDSDSDSEDDKNTKKPPPTASSSSAPMTASRHAELLAQLTSFVKGPAAAGEDLDIDIDAVGYITEDSEDEDDVEDEDADELRQDEDGFMMMGEEGAVDIVMDGQAVDMDALRELMNAKKVEEEKRATMMATTTTRTSQSPKQKQTDAASSSSSDSDSSDSDSSDSDSEEESSTLPARLAQVDMSDYEEENETAPSGPLKTEHEILEEPVQLPPFYRLGEGARVILAGEVVSFMRDSGLGVWEEWQRAQKVKEEAEAEAEAEKVIGDEEKKVQEVIGDESGQISESVEPVVEAGQVDVDVEVEVATSETLRVDATAATLVKDDPVDGTTTTVVQPEPSAEQTPIIAMDAQAPATTASQTPQTTTSQTAATKRPRNRAGKRRPNDASKGKQTSTTNKPAGPPAPKSSGTVVVQALRPPVGTVKGGTDRLDEDGWLLDGSVICTGEGEAVAVVAEVFGPTAQPFYLLKLPPPPFPVPSADQLARGTKLYYPADGDHAYVPVRMLKTDKRFKGTDASNLYDEEPAEHEMEWSDDEEEQAAKRKLKADKRGKKTGNDNYALPRRQPHFDTASTAGRNSDDDDEMSIHYGGAGGGGGGDSSMRDDRSDAGYSVASSSARSRRVAQSYGDLYDTQASVGYRASPESTRGGGGRGRGSARGARGGRVADRFGDAPPTAAVSSQSTQRNQDGGRQIGRGAGRGRGGERGRGRGGQQQQQQARGAGTGRRQEQHQSRQQIPPPSANLPARPRDLSPTSAHIARVTSEAGSSNVQAQPQQQPQMQQASQGYNPMLGMSPFGWAPQAMGQMPMGMGMPGMPMGMPMGMMGGQMFSPYFAPQQQPQQQSQQSGGGGQQYPAQAQTQGQQGVPGMPAINPRFMQQYQQMMAQYQGQAQGQGQGQGGPQQQ